MKVCEGCPDRFKDCVQLDPDQSLPEPNLDIHIWRDYTPDMAYEKAQRDMLDAGFRRVKKWTSM